MPPRPRPPVNIEGLPDEILCTIFRAAAPHPKLEAFDLPMPLEQFTLSRVSHHWRAVVLGDPLLWHSIHYNTRVKHNFELCQLFFERSQQSALNIQAMIRGTDIRLAISPSHSQMREGGSSMRILPLCNLPFPLVNHAATRMTRFVSFRRVSQPGDIQYSVPSRGSPEIEIPPLCIVAFRRSATQLPQSARTAPGTIPCNFRRSIEGYIPSYY